MSDATFLRDLQNHCQAKLLSEAGLSKVVIVCQRNQVLLDVASRQAPHLGLRNGYTGAGIQIGLPSAEPTDDDIPGAQFWAKLPISILVKDDISLVVSNGAGITAEEIVYWVWRYLSQFLNQYLGSGNWTVAGFDPIEDQAGAYGYMMVLQVRRADDQPPKCSNVTGAWNAGSIVLQCTTPGATIYYTTDGSFPGPWVAQEGIAANTSQQYAAPVAVASGTVVLAAAWANGFDGSDVWAFTAP
ncbi:MAG: chitobiase/beta-hexosaminidase C-terminal domain-containing protein [Patescibacteria group bacterium]|nr:chitobiase/beta-hexosaminidase C-terminal domain-containing protein [Patescibacteria group bacterium]